MRKALLLLFVATMFACGNSDDTPSEPTIEEQLAANWQLTEVDYSSTIPTGILGTSPLPISGSGTNLTGDFSITTDPNRIVWSYSFDAAIPILGTLPVSQSNSADWSWDESTQMVNLSLDDGTSMSLKLISFEADEVVFTSILPYAVPQVGTIDVNLQLTLNRQ